MANYCGTTILRHRVVYPVMLTPPVNEIGYISGAIWGAWIGESVGTYFGGDIGCFIGVPLGVISGMTVIENLFVGLVPE